MTKSSLVRLGYQSFGGIHCPDLPPDLLHIPPYNTSCKVCGNPYILLIDFFLCSMHWGVLTENFMKIKSV
jgi:hypothetical protein